MSAQQQNITNSQDIYKKISKFIPEAEWKIHAPLIDKINKLKKEKNAIILAHNYQTTEIYHCVADIAADSLALAVEAAKTSADVKAETDVCCTSANAVKVVESLNVDKVIFLPDQYLADYVAKNTKVKIISWKGTCVVHEQFTGKEIEDIKNQNPGIKVIAHPECPPDVIEASDFAGSTSGMVKYVKENQPKKVMLVTECSMSDNVEADNPNVSFIKPCNLCPYMKKIDLEKILDCLENDTNEILLDNKTIEAARKSVIRMTEIGR